MDLNTVLVFAARYAYPRKTGVAAYSVVRAILAHWGELEQKVKDQLYRESKTEAQGNSEDWKLLWDKYEIDKDPIEPVGVWKRHPTPPPPPPLRYVNEDVKPEGYETPYNTWMIVVGVVGCGVMSFLVSKLLGG